MLERFMAEWQDISTIPQEVKDKEAVVWLWDGEERWLAAWSKGSMGSEYDCWRCQGYVNIEEQSWREHPYQRLSLTSGVIEPTHFMLLPEIPE